MNLTEAHINMFFIWEFVAVWGSANLVNEDDDQKY